MLSLLLYLSVAVLSEFSETQLPLSAVPLPVAFVCLP